MVLDIWNPLNKIHTEDLFLDIIAVDIESVIVSRSVKAVIVTT